MGLLSRLLLDKTYRRVAVAGGTGRGHLVRKMIDWATAEGLKVAVTSLSDQKMLPSGDLILSRNPQLAGQLAAEKFAVSSVLHLGKSLDDRLVCGFTLNELKKIKIDRQDLFWIIELGGAAERMIPARAHILNWIKSDFFDQLVFCAEIENLDKPLSGDFIEKVTEFKKFTGRQGKLTQNILTRFFNDDKEGMGKLFKQRWPVLLLFVDTNLTARENRAISFGRELLQNGVHHIALFNSELNTVKRLKL